MPHDPTPWAVEGDANHTVTHSAGVARLAIANAGNPDKEGVIGPTDCQCKALATPGTSIRLTPGAYRIKARHLDSAGQIYTGRVITDDVVPVTATGAGAGRSDLVIVRIENPYVSGEPWALPPNGENNPYVFTRIIEGVAANTTTVQSVNSGWTAIPIARLDIPASTATITQGMIVDLRKTGAPKGQDDHDVTTPGPATPQTLTPSDTSYKDFPTQLSQSVFIPRGTTTIRITAKLQGVATQTGSFTGKLRLVVNGVNLQEWPISGLAANTPVNVNFTETYKSNALIVLWGSTINIKVQGKWTSGTGTLSFSDSGTSTLRVIPESQPIND